MDLNKTDIQSLEKRYRATLINSLAGVRPAVLVGTRSLSGQSNLAIFNSLIHIGADPALWGLLIRPATVRRDTLSNIQETGSYTINFISADLHKSVHMTSAKFSDDISEFNTCGFEEENIEGINAPFVRNGAVKAGMKLVSAQELSLNGTILVIGSIEKIIAADEFLTGDGFFNPEKANVLTCAGLDAYTRVVMNGRWSYARPDQPVQPLEF
ncbi:MAG: flavin reductase family protein [Cyclobacteriaceae bacterium]